MPHILYIEDNFENRLLVRRILTASGFDVADVDNAREGITMAVACPPDVILMDMSMPEMDGLTATMHLREIPDLDDVAIIALTANVMDGDREAFLDAGCDGYIPKPIDVDNFVDEICSYIGSRR